MLPRSLGILTSFLLRFYLRLKGLLQAFILLPQFVPQIFEALLSLGFHLRRQLQLLRKPFVGFSLSGSDSIFCSLLKCGVGS